MLTKNLKKNIILGAFSVLLGTASVSAEVVFSWTLNLSLATGSDEQQMNGASMTFTGVTSETTYSNHGWGEVTVVLPTFDVTVSGSGNSNNNGTFAMVLDFSSPATLPNYHGSFLALANKDGGDASFSFGDASTYMTLWGTKPESSTAYFGGPISASDFDGALLNPGSIWISGSTYTFESAVVTSAVPEPASAAALAGIATLAVVGASRRRHAARS